MFILSIQIACIKDKYDITSLHGKLNSGNWMYLCSVLSPPSHKMCHFRGSRESSCQTYQAHKAPLNPWQCLTHPCNNIIPSMCVPQSDWLVAALVKLAWLQGNPSPDFSSGLDPKAMWEMAPFSKLGECFHTWGKEWLDMAWFLASQRNELEGEGGPRTSAHSSAAYSVLLSRSVNKRERGNVGSTFRAKRCKLSEVTTAWAEAGRVCGFFTCGPSHGCCWAHGHCPATRNLQDWVSWAGVSKAKCSVLVCPGF